MQTEIHNISTLLQQVFVKNAWHGPSVLEVLNAITAEQSSKRIGNTHSIIELVRHMTAWRIFVINKLEGNTTYKVTDELNFPVATNWELALLELKESQEKLMQATQQFPEEKLHEIVPNNTNQYTFYTLLHGILHHDLYHLGQIVLITKSIV